MTTITCNIHTDADTKIFCKALRTPYCGTNVVNIDGLTIFADEATLRRLADAINARLVILETQQVAA